MKIGWFGLGKLGMISSEMLVKKGHTVTGYDKEERFSGLVRVSKTPKQAVVGQDFVFVAVQTPHHKDYGGESPITHLPNKDFGLDPVKECLKEINKYATEDTIVVLILSLIHI